MSRGGLAVAACAAMMLSSCGKDLPSCDVDDYIVRDIGTDDTTDCGSFSEADPSLDLVGITAAQTCVISAAAAPGSFKFVYDRQIRVVDASGGTSVQTTREGWEGTVDTGKLAIRRYTQPVATDGSLGELSVASCDGVAGAYFTNSMYGSTDSADKTSFYGWGVDDGGCNPIAPNKLSRHDPSAALVAGPIYDACLLCVNPSPAAPVCQ